MGLKLSFLSRLPATDGLRPRSGAKLSIEETLCRNDIASAQDSAHLLWKNKETEAAAKKNFLALTALGVEGGDLAG